MKLTHPIHSSSVQDAELRLALDQVLSRHFDVQVEIESVSRNPMITASSYPLETLDVHFCDGRSLPLVFKDLGPESLSADACLAKPSFLRNPLREIEVYERFLNPDRDGTARCLGSIFDSDTNRYWLFLERVNGEEMYQIGDLHIWSQVASWLARFHDSFVNRFELFNSDNQLLRLNKDHFWIWPNRALRNLRARSAPPESVAEICRLVERYHHVVNRVSWLPETLVHGEFYPSNVLIQRSGPDLRICPIDWEMSAAGPALLDLAALVSGRWSEQDRRLLIEAYHDALSDSSMLKLPLTQFVEILDACRLHLAIQWLGWSVSWSPPPEHMHDWLGEAIDLAVKLRL